MHLIDLLSPARVQRAGNLPSKKRLLETLARTLADGAGGDTESQIYDSLCARERLGATGLGHGVAIRMAARPA